MSSSLSDLVIIDDDIVMESEPELFIKLKDQLGEASISFDRLKTSVGNCLKHDHCLILEPVHTSQRVFNKYCHSEEELKNLMSTPSMSDSTLTTGSTSSSSYDVGINRIQALFGTFVQNWEILMVEFRELVMDQPATFKSKFKAQLESITEKIKQDVIYISKFIYRAPISSQFIIIFLNNLQLFDEAFIIHDLFEIWEHRIGEMLSDSKKNFEKRILYDIDLYYGKFLLSKILSEFNNQSATTDINKLQNSLLENYNLLKYYSEEPIK